MENRKQPVIIFIAILVVLSFAFQWIYYILVKEKDINIVDLLIDLPVIFLMAFIDLLIVHSINKRFKYRNNLFARVALELFVTSLFVGIYTFAVQYFLRVILTDTETVAFLRPAIIMLLGNIVIVLMLELFFYNRRQQETAKHIALIEKERAEFLYATLKSQINPHFLFNNLNVLSSLTFEEPQKANIFTKKLSNIYRYVLSTNMLETVTVKEEINFIESYIYLLSIRFEKTLVISINGDRNMQKQIIPVSLQLLVENAIKHNIASLEKPLTVNINITSGYIEVANNLQPRMKVAEGGYGLNNLQKQYAMHDKTIEVLTVDSMFIVRIPYL